MVLSTQLVRGVQYEEIMKGVDNETRRTVEDALVFFCNDEDDALEAQKARSDKLRAAYTALVNFLVNNSLNNLNPYQVTFLCTGALGDRLTIQTPHGLEEIDFLPREVYEKLFKDSTIAPLALPFPVMNVIDRYHAVAKGDLLAFDMGDDRKKALRNSPADQKRFRDRWSREGEQAKSEITAAVNQLDIYMPKLLAAIHETALKNAKVGLELLKKVTAAWGKGTNATPQDRAVLNAFEGKVGDAGAGMARWTAEVQDYLSKINENARVVDERYQYIQKAIAEIGKIDNSNAPLMDRKGPLFSGDALADVKKDTETTASVSVRPAETSALKVTFSGSRILCLQHFTEGENFMERICTRENVLTSLEKITAIHTNLFMKDVDGRYIVPAICIEPLRNFVDFFDDRFIMALVSGESFRKGPFSSFTPVDLQVLRMCALYLTKDPIYDYRGDIKTGTFMGDYVGRVEKSTKVKWTGQDKKFTLAATSSMTDAASRDDAIIDYMDFIYAMVNGLAPNPKLSKRKINVLLKYVLFDKIEKNIAGILRLVAQTEPAEAKESIMHFAREKLDVAKDMIKAALAIDPQTSKMFSDNPEFAISRVFGRGG
jgi:hypothetical protein